MVEAEDARDMAQQPAPNPDAQTTVNDFLDYTEFFPSDLVRSLTLIGDLDSNYRDAVQQVHDLTALYGQLPALPEQERPDPVSLRKQIAQFLQKAISQREYAYTEASRLHEVTVRHCQRSSIIKRKLQAQPEPPSRDPTPPPVSPSAQRSYIRTYERTPHLRLTLDGGRHSSGARPRDRHRKPGALPSRRPRAHSASSDSDESDIRSNIDLAIPVRKHKANRDRHGARVRAQGVLGTNVHSSVAGISTSNALAQLVPPPADARPGSKWAPWLKLTEWEMAVLRKAMKKNAVWTPSLTMVNRELEKKHRTQADYDREKARCEDAGEEMLDEEPESLQDLIAASDLGQTGPGGLASENTQPLRDDYRDEGGTISIRLKPAAAKDGRKMDRLSRQQQASRDTQELEKVSSRIHQAADGLKGLTFTPPLSQKKHSASRPSNKRKRDLTPPPGTESATNTPREASVATQESGSKRREPKRPRLDELLSDGIASPIASPSPATLTPREHVASDEYPSTDIDLDPASDFHRQPSEGVTVQVPLAPAGPSTPKASKVTPVETSESPPPPVPSPTSSSAAVDATEPVAAPSTAPAQSVATAASSRPRRESAAAKATSPSNAGTQSMKTSKASTPDPELKVNIPAHAPRPRSARGHIPTQKAQSEEPKPNEITRITRETRRHSIFSQSALTAPASTRMSTRKKPPPKGEVTATEDGKKTVTNVKRAQGSKNKKKKKTEEEAEAADDIDPDEEKYCICDDVSYGAMISCDNKCDREWFHLPCVHMTEADIPARRAKWYCPDCRTSLNIDAYGNPRVPPPLPGRRGNRSA
ncbi:hypothetical protein DE146DRAFT_640893 [Phaeosphaeria sp. MPI-PUGE-AT-0046c]|nr:hypothetical protein DE146DRAFT_640893 [Phaeosphaeria sp. MPI-PUGE-AT-0046c]